MSATAPADDADAMTQPTTDAAGGSAAVIEIPPSRLRDGSLRMAPHGVRARGAANGAFGDIKFQRSESTPGSGNVGDAGRLDDTLTERLYHYTGLPPCSFPPSIRFCQSLFLSLPLPHSHLLLAL